MSRQKETLILPSIKEESNKQRPSLGSSPVALSKTGPDFVTKHNIKKISTWFKTWLHWQKRIFLCRVIEHCLKQHLEFLATSLEPILHFDFSSSLSPHLQSLHLDGVATFQVHRPVVQSVVNPEVLEAGESLSYLHSLPSTLHTDTSNGTLADELSAIGPAKSSRKLPLPAGISREMASPNLIILTERSSRSLEVQDTGAVSHPTRVKHRDTILPVLPLTHTQHVTGLNSSRTNSFEDVVALRRKQFSSVPDFKSTTDLLKGVREKRVLKASKTSRHHRKSRTFAGYSTHARRSGDDSRNIEYYKTQLAAVSTWLEKWSPSQKSFLLLEIIKLCDKELLGYFVQCLYQRLQEEVSIDSLPDAIFLRIFSFLDPHSLAQCAMVCKRWHHLSSSDGLWHHHSKVLGEMEGVGDLASAVETAAHGLSNSEGGGHVDWKRAYWELNKVMTRIKTLVVKAAKAQEEREKAELAMASPQPTSSTIRGKMTLQEMLQLLRSRSQTPGSSTTQELVRSAPESAATMRRRLRAERRSALEQAERERREELEMARYKHHRPSEYRPSSRMSPLFGSLSKSPGGARSTMEDIAENQRRLEEWSKKMAAIELVREAIDRRPAVPYLPDPSGIQCLILAGCLLGNQTPRPGRVQPIPAVRRLKMCQRYQVLCLQFDMKKVVMGTEDRELVIHDIRTGRHIHTLKGHKGSVQCLQFDDNKIVSGSWDTSIIVWDVIHFTSIKELHGHTDCVSSLQFDKERLVSGSHDGSVRVWSTSSWSCLTIIGSAHQGAVSCVQMNELCIASGATDKCVKLWSSTSYECLATFTLSSSLSSLLLSNLLLVASTTDGGVSLYDTHCHAPLMEWSLPPEVYFTDMAIGGSKVYGAGSDGVLYEWDMCTGNCARTLTGHSRPLTCVKVDEGKLIVTAGEDYSVALWYSKKILSKEDSSEEEESEFFEDLPIRVVTQM